MISEDCIRNILNNMLDNVIIEKKAGIFNKDEVLKEERLKILEYFNRKSEDTENLIIISLILTEYTNQAC